MIYTCYVRQEANANSRNVKKKRQIPKAYAFLPPT
jgi:hypothetical protein